MLSRYPESNLPIRRIIGARLVRIYTGRQSSNNTITIGGGGSGDICRTQIVSAILPLNEYCKTLRITNAPSFFLEDPRDETGIVCESPLVNYIHCVISYGRVFDYRNFQRTRDWGHTILDMDSQYGTYLNGWKLNSHQALRLRFGDIISLGAPLNAEDDRLDDPSFCVFRYEADYGESDSEYRYFGADGTVSTMPWMLPSPPTFPAKPSTPVSIRNEGMTLRSKRMKAMEPPNKGGCAKKLKFDGQEQSQPTTKRRDSPRPQPKSGQYQLTPSVTVTVVGGDEEKNNHLSMLATVAASRDRRMDTRSSNSKVPPLAPRRLTASEEFFKNKLPQLTVTPTAPFLPRNTGTVPGSGFKIPVKEIPRNPTRRQYQRKGSDSLLITRTGAKPILLRTRSTTNSNRGRGGSNN